MEQKKEPQGFENTIQFIYLEVLPGTKTVEGITN